MLLIVILGEKLRRYEKPADDSLRAPQEHRRATCNCSIYILAISQTGICSQITRVKIVVECKIAR